MPAARLTQLGFTIALAGCSSAAPLQDAPHAGASSEPAPSFQSLYAEVISRQCLPCHSPPGLSSFLDLSSAGTAYHSLVSSQASSAGVCQGAGALVIPGDCARSLLYRKLLAQEQPCGSRMPLRNAPVSDLGIDEVCEWIQAGARE